MYPMSLISVPYDFALLFMLLFSFLLNARYANIIAEIELIILIIVITISFILFVSFVATYKNHLAKF